MKEDWPQAKPGRMITAVTSSVKRFTFHFSLVGCVCIYSEL